MLGRGSPRSGTVADVLQRFTERVHLNPVKTCCRQSEPDRGRFYDGSKSFLIADRYTGSPGKRIRPLSIRMLLRGMRT